MLSLEEFEIEVPPQIEEQECGHQRGNEQQQDESTALHKIIPWPEYRKIRSRDGG